MTLPERYFAQHETPLVEAFGKHLSSHRLLNGRLKHVGALSEDKPDLGPGEARLPHLVVQEQQTGLEDKIIWERLPRDDAEIWLGGELPDTEFVERHLDVIQSIKKAVRNNPLDSIKHDTLRDRLHDRYISILFIYQNMDVIREILECPGVIVTYEE